jgi:hypothetical protein
VDAATVSRNVLVKYDIVAFGVLLVQSPFCSKNSIPHGEAHFWQNVVALKKENVFRNHDDVMSVNSHIKRNRSFTPTTFFASSACTIVVMTMFFVAVLQTGATLFDC